MLCSKCNKNAAVIFTNKIEDGKPTIEGLCYDCAKKMGINPIELLAQQANLSKEDLEDMSNQFEEFFNDISNSEIIISCTALAFLLVIFLTPLASIPILPKSLV